MVQATFIVSALVALVAVVSAVPSGSLVDLKTGKYIGTGNIYAEKAASRVVNADNLHVNDVAQGVDVAGDRHGRSGLLGGLLHKRGGNKAGKGKRVKMAKKGKVAMNN